MQTERSHPSAPPVDPACFSSWDIRGAYVREVEIVEPGRAYLSITASPDGPTGPGVAWRVLCRYDSGSAIEVIVNGLLIRALRADLGGPLQVALGGCFPHEDSAEMILRVTWITVRADTVGGQPACAEDDDG
ncbi:MAG: hypothetical protein AAGN46_01330 [Acidobacteriota bacterium]